MPDRPSTLDISPWAQGWRAGAHAEATARNDDVSQPGRNLRDIVEVLACTAPGSPGAMATADEATIVARLARIYLPPTGPATPPLTSTLPPPRSWFPFWLAGWTAAGILALLATLNPGDLPWYAPLASLTAAAAGPHSPPAPAPASNTAPATEHASSATQAPPTPHSDAMPRRITRRHPAPGRPTKWSPEVADTILTAVRAGNYIGDAVEHAGISTSTFYRWLGEADEDGADPELVAFRDDVTRARASAKVRVVALVSKAIAGGYPLKEVTRSYRDENGRMVTEKEVLRAPIDGKLGLEFLSRVDPGQWGRRQGVELSGAGGGPVQVQAVQLEDLGARLQALVESREADEVEAGDWVAGEVVDDAEGAA